MTIIETINKTTFKFQLDNNIGSFELDAADKSIIFGNEALLVSDHNNSGKTYLVMRRDRFDHWLVTKLENLFKGHDSIEHLEEIIKDFAEAFGSTASEEFIKYCGEETNKKFLKFILFKTIFDVYANDHIIGKMFNFNSDDEGIRSEAINRMKKYFDLNFIGEFTLADNRYVDHQLFVFEVCR